MTREHGDVTELLKRWQAGDEGAADQLLTATYQEMRRMARGMFRGERQNHTLQPTALVHEAYLRLFQDEPVDVTSESKFRGLIARNMRNQLIDHARRRAAVKRGRGKAAENVDELADRIPAPPASSNETDILDHVEDSLKRYAAVNPRAARMFELRYVAGMSNEEVADEMGYATGTVKRDLLKAKTWLKKDLADVE